MPPQQWCTPPARQGDITILIHKTLQTFQHILEALHTGTLSYLVGVVEVWCYRAGHSGDFGAGVIVHYSQPARAKWTEEVWDHQQWL